MAQYRRKSPVVEAITFDELVQHGREHGGNIVNGMPWSFDYQGHPITHESDDCYLIPTFTGTERMERGYLLVTYDDGRIYPVDPDLFMAKYEPVPTTSPPTPTATQIKLCPFCGRDASVLAPSGARTWWAVRCQGPICPASPHTTGGSPTEAIERWNQRTALASVEREGTQAVDDLHEAAWGLLANVSGGDWGLQSPEWQEAVLRWRERYFAALDAYCAQRREVANGSGS